MSYLVPVEIPDLEPLRQSFEYDQLETELKEAFFAVFERMIRPAERQLNLYGMPHLGDDVLIERALKDAGMAIVRRNSVRSGFLLKAAKARNPRRGMLFLAQYLQSVWPNVWKIEQLWHPVALAAEYPAHAVPHGVIDLGNDVTAELDANSADGIPTLYRTDWQGKQQLYPVARTNLLLGSNFPQANAYWGKSNCTITPNNVIAPDGTMTAATITRTAPGNHYLFQSANDASPVGKTYAFSVWMRAGTMAGDVRVWLKDGAGTQLSATLATLTSEWTRFWAIATVPVGAAANIGCYVDPVNDAGAAGETFEVWGGQLERLVAPVAGPGSLIPTVAAPVTLADYTVDANGVATFAGGLPEPTPVTYFRTSRVRVTMPVSSDNGLGLEEVGKAFRPTLAARLLIELQLALTLENTGQNGGFALSCGAAGGAMPFMAIGTLS